MPLSARNRTFRRTTSMRSSTLRNCQIQSSPKPHVMPPTSGIWPMPRAISDGHHQVPVQVGRRQLGEQPVAFLIEVDEPFDPLGVAQHFGERRMLRPRPVGRLDGAPRASGQSARGNKETEPAATSNRSGSETRVMEAFLGSEG